MQCSECRHFKNITDYRRPNGTCHRHAPKAALEQIPAQIPAESGNTPDFVVFLARWPEVPRDESCGDFEPIEQHTTTTDERASLPPEPKVESKPEQQLDTRPLPPAKEALVMIREYLEEAMQEFDAYELVINAHRRELTPAGMAWIIEARYGDADYNFAVGPDGIMNMV